jgi:hypothetical protein
MLVSDKDEALVKAATTVFRELSAERKTIQNDARTYGIRTSKAAGAFQKKIFDKALTLAGISPIDIKNRQTDNDASDQKFLQSLEPRVAKNSESIAARQKALAKKLRTGYEKLPHYHPPGPPPPPPPAPGPVYAILDAATSITAPDGQPIDFATSIAAWSNVLRFQFTGGQNHSFEFDFSFVWTPPHDGNVTMFSPVNANGSNWWAAQHGCVEALLEQDVEAELGIFVAGNEQSGTLLDSQSILYKYWDKHPGCSSDIGMNIIDQSPILTYSGGYPVSGGIPIVVLVAITVEFWADEALGGIDFFTSAKQIDVPGVVLYLS